MGGHRHYWPTKAVAATETHNDIGIAGERVRAHRQTSIRTIGRGHLSDERDLKLGLWGVKL